MVIDGNKGNSANDYFLKPGNIEQNQNSFQTPTVPRSEGYKSFMEMEGRGLSDLYRNSSEELFLRSYMESAIAIPGPNMDMLSFKNLSQNFRTDSEELFKSWLTNGEASNCFFLIDWLWFLTYCWINLSRTTDLLLMNTILDSEEEINSTTMSSLLSFCFLLFNCIYWDRNTNHMVVKVGFRPIDGSMHLCCNDLYVCMSFICTISYTKNFVCALLKVSLLFLKNVVFQETS